MAESNGREDYVGDVPQAEDGNRLRGLSPLVGWRQTEILSLRSGVNDLRVDTSRRQRPYLPREQRVCEVCSSGEVEDEPHFLLTCMTYTNLRKDLFRTVLSEGKTDLSFPCASAEDRFRKLSMLLGDPTTFPHLQCGNVRTAVMRFIRQAFYLRTETLEARTRPPKNSASCCVVF